MSAIMKIRQARNPEQIADAIEPLTLSLATLADQAQSSIKAMEKASSQQAWEWNGQQKNAAKAVETAAEAVTKHTQALHKATQSLQATIETLRKAQNRQHWKTLGLVSYASTIAATLSTALWLWLAPAHLPPAQVNLDPKTVAEQLKPELLEALKRR